MLFPEIDSDEEGERAPTRTELAKAKLEACRRLREHSEHVLHAFRSYLWSVYHVYPDAVMFDVEGALSRINDAVFTTECPDLYAETDGTTIWISKIAMNFAEVVATLIHEALHDSVFVLRSTRYGHRRVMSCHDEHCVMSVLGCPIGV